MFDSGFGQDDPGGQRYAGEAVADEPNLAVIVKVPEAMTPQELSDAVQQALAIEKLGLRTQGNRVMMRGPMSKVIPAQEVFRELVCITSCR